MDNPISPWSDEDAKKVVDYLNLVAKHAKFDMNTQELIAYFKALSWMQQSLLGKIKDSEVSDMKVYTPDEVKGKPKKG